MKTRAFHFPLLAAILTVALAACTAEGGTIYYILENEQKQPVSSLGKNISVSDIVPLGGAYYVAAGSIWKGAPNADGTVSWDLTNKIAPVSSGPLSGALCTSLVAFQGTAATTSSLYGGFILSGSSLGLYKAGGTDGTDFSAATQVTDANIVDAQVIRLIVADSGRALLAITALPDSGATTDTPPFAYSLSVSTDGVTFTPLLTSPTNASGTLIPIADASYDGTTYYATAGNLLFSGTAGQLAGTSALGSYTIADTDVLQGLYEVSENLYVSSKASGIYLLSGGSWVNYPAEQQSGTAVSYFDFYGPLPDSGNMLVGSDGYGYYYLTPTTSAGSAPSRSADSTMITLELYSASVLRFFVDTASNIVMACTAGNGLWLGKVDSANLSGVSNWTIQ